MPAFLKLAGDYTSWNVYRKAVIICDVTELFINRALPRGSRTIATRQYCIINDDPATFVAKCKQRSDETVANIMITQIRQIDAMLAKVLKKVEADFITNGGIKEAMTTAPKHHRGY